MKEKNVLEKRELANIELLKKIKSACVEYLKKEGLYQSTVNHILLTFHIVSYELFAETIKMKLKKKK